MYSINKDMECSPVCLPFSSASSVPEMDSLSQLKCREEKTKDISIYVDTVSVGCMVACCWMVCKWTVPCDGDTYRIYSGN